MVSSLFITQGHIIDPGQDMDMVGDLFITEGKIAGVGQSGTLPYQENTHAISAQGMIVCPGFIDLHCHLRQSVSEDSVSVAEKETIATGTRAAARGGFTTVCCMANTEPPVDTPDIVEFICYKARDEGIIRVLPIGCITLGRSGNQLTEMDKLAEAGVVGFSDDGSPVLNSCLMRHAMECSRLLDLPIIEHCEDPILTKGGVMNEGMLSGRLGLRGMPAVAEETWVYRVLALAELTGARLHIAHLSTARAVELVRCARKKGIRVTAEATPHHLTMTEEGVSGYNTNAKVNPPLRTEKDRKTLVSGLSEGVIDVIATDHAPHTLGDKHCEFNAAAFGISGLETALGCLMGLVHRGELSLNTLISRLTTAPARILHRDDIGTLKIGSTADITIFDPEAEWVVNPDEFASRGKNTPWAGHTLKGKLMITIFGGEILYQDSTIHITRSE